LRQPRQKMSATFTKRTTFLKQKCTLRLQSAESTLHFLKFYKILHRETIGLRNDFVIFLVSKFFTF